MKPASKRLFHPVILLAALWLAGSLARAETIPSDSPLAKAIDTCLSESAKTKAFRGSVFIRQHGKTLFHRSYGMANEDYRIPNTPRTKFRIGSCSKQFTSMAVMMLQERGLIATTNLLSAYIGPNDFALPAAWSNITVRQCLSMNSGLPNLVKLPNWKTFKHLRHTPLELIADFKDAPLDFPPGTQYEYCNSGYLIFGYLIEKLSGLSYEEFLRQNIFAPLGMTNSGCDRSETILPDRAAGYSLSHDQPPRLVNADHIDMSNPWSAGAIYTTTEDMARWDEALYTTQLVSQASMDEIFSDYVGPQKSLHEFGYGYAWFVSPKGVGPIAEKYLFHVGEVEGFYSHISRVPDRGRLCVVILSNQEKADIFGLGMQLTFMTATWKDAPVRPAP